MLHEDLGLVLEPPEGGGMDDPVAVALVTASRRAFGLLEEPSAARFRTAGETGAGRRRHKKRRQKMTDGYRRGAHGLCSGITTD
jgi:hypothetical protein